MTTSAPASARATAEPAPIPRPAPVMTATWPSTLKRSRIMPENVTGSSFRRKASGSVGVPTADAVLLAGHPDGSCSDEHQAEPGDQQHQARTTGVRQVRTLRRRD